MNPRFLREEATRFRDMAATSDREASKVRLLAMAADFEARAEAAQHTAAPPPPDEVVAPVEEASPGDAPTVKPVRRLGRSLDRTITAKGLGL